MLRGLAPRPEKRPFSPRHESNSGARKKRHGNDRTASRGRDGRLSEEGIGGVGVYLRASDITVEGFEIANFSQGILSGYDTNSYTNLRILDNVIHDVTSGTHGLSSLTVRRRAAWLPDLEFQFEFDTEPLSDAGADLVDEL